MTGAELVNLLPQMLPRLWAFALRISGDQHDAEDLVQRACVRGLERTYQLQAGTSPITLMVAPRSEECKMGSGEKCLRTLVDKWFGLPSVMTIRVMEFSRTRVDGRRYACVGAASADGNLTIAFFRHDDGSWNVFPAKASRSAMRAYPPAA